VSCQLQRTSREAIIDKLGRSVYNRSKREGERAYVASCLVTWREKRRSLQAHPVQVCDGCAVWTRSTYSRVQAIMTITDVGSAGSKAAIGFGLASTKPTYKS